VQLGRLRVQRVVPPIAGRDAIHERRDTEGDELLLADTKLQLTDAAHAVQPTDTGQADEAVRVLVEQLRHLVIGSAEGHGADDAHALHHLHVRGQLGVRARVTAPPARAEDPLVIGHAVAGRALLRGRGRRRVRGRRRGLGRAPGDVALHVDHSHRALLLLRYAWIVAYVVGPRGKT